jgi:hypothetical protein
MSTQQPIKWWRITFSYRGYIAGVLFNESRSESEAIESAKLYINAKWTKVRAELVEEIEHKATGDNT